MIAANLLFDNAVLLKHVRSRLRRHAVVTWSIIVAAISMCITWANLANLFPDSAIGLTLILGIQTIVLLISGSHQVGCSVGGARETGILDFHRVAPQPPLWLALGYFFGAPLREYVLFAVTLPFALANAFASSAGLYGFIELELPLLLACLVFHAVALLSALIARKPKSAGTSGFGAFLILLVFLGQPVGYALWYAAGPLHESNVKLEFFGIPLPWALYLLVYEVPILIFLFIAAVRKMRADKAHAYSKALAVVCLATLVTLAVGGLWQLRGMSYLALAMLYGSVLLSLVLCVTITPDRGEYIRGLRRAARRNRRRPSPWDDAGTNRLAILLLCAVVLIGTTATWELIEGHDRRGPAQYSLTIAIGIFAIASFGLGLQFFRLRFPRHASSYFSLFLFFTWGLPVFAGVILLAAQGQFVPVGQAVVAASPIIGIALSANAMEATGGDAVQLFALGPVITFAFLFNYGVVVVQRRIDRAVRETASDRDLASI